MSTITLITGTSIMYQPSSDKITAGLASSIFGNGLVFDDSTNRPFMWERSNCQTSTQTISGGSEEYITGTKILLPIKSERTKMRVVWYIGLTKTAGSSGAVTYRIKMGTAGTTADSDITTFSRTMTAVDDSGILQIDMQYRLVGLAQNSTGMALSINAHMNHLLANTGLSSGGGGVQGTEVSILQPTQSQNLSSNVYLGVGVSANFAGDIFYASAVQSIIDS